MPQLWNETIASHREAVRGATLDATAALVAESGLHSVTMSRIAERTGISRATLYRYFPDVESILFAWHEREIAGHLEKVSEARDRAGTPEERLEAVLETYARSARRHHGGELAVRLHRGEHVGQAEHRLRELIRDLLVEGAKAGIWRTDVAPEELASYCLHSLSAARELRSSAATKRLVGVTLDGLRP